MATLPEPETTEAEVHAFRALFAGTADAAQQRMVCKWIERATGMWGVPYVAGPDGERDTLVLIGGKRVGVMIGNMATLEALEAARALAELKRNPPAQLTPAARRETRRHNSQPKP